MTQYSPFYQFQERPQVFEALGTFGYGQYGDAQRSKTPMSLINHTGLSPGPLSTPSGSRNASQGPEPLPDQPPDSMMFVDELQSLSGSPTSIRTPDDEFFQADMLESTESMRNFYQSQDGGLLASASQGVMPSIETNVFFNAQGNFSDQAIYGALNATLAARGQHQQYPTQSSTQFTMQSRPIQNTLPFSNLPNQSLNRHPSQPDAWNSQAPPRNPNVPRSSAVFFDPVTDPMDYTPYVSPDVSRWTIDNTDPNYLVSPNDPPSQDFFAMPSQGFVPQQAQPRLRVHPLGSQAPTRSPISPIGFELTEPSPSPDSSNFVNYDSNSALFTDNYITDMASPARGNSPQATASSPSSSGYFSYQSDSGSGMMLDPFPSNNFGNQQFLPPPSPAQPQRSPITAIPEMSFESSPEPEQPVRRSGAKGSGRPGGRALGTHLDAKVAKAAHDMRKIVACWHCVLQRDKCGPGDICDRCMKRAQRPNADCGLGCSRIKLVELTQYFLPMLIMQIHEDMQLTHFVSQYIHQWHNVEITLYMTCSQKSMPRIPVKVYEFVPRGDELLVQLQFHTNQQTQERYTTRKKSPALGMVHINYNEEKKYDKYISDIVENHLDAFADICWDEDDNDFAPRLFKLMTRVKAKNEDEAKLLREVFRLVVCTYIMSHTITIAEETKLQTLSKMHSYTGPNAYVQHHTSPRMTNRQLKYFFARLQRNILSNVLNKLQQIFKSSKGCDKWLAAFIAVVGMCMAHEDQQKTIHQVMQGRATTEGFDQRDAQAQADIACREIDGRMSFISQIFRWKYNRKCNPLKDPDQEWEGEAGFEDESHVTFIRSVAQLCKDNMNYLSQRQNISISQSNQAKYTARLIGNFLLSFWLPS